MKKQQSGFTLIELMIVVAIVGILAAIAVPAYQDYTVRGKITEALGLLAAAKTSVSTYRLTQANMPASNTDAGIGTNIRSDYVRSVDVGAGGVITVVLNGTNVGQSGTITFTPTYSRGTVNWACTSTLDNQYLPSNCRT